MVYLSDLKAAGYRHIPYLQLSWPYRTDRSVLGARLRVGGRVFLKGLGMHSPSRLTYDLLQPYRRFDAQLAIDDDAGGSFNDVVFDDAFASADITPTYDDNGNLTFDGVYKFKCDAWNRLVEVRAGQQDESVFATYTYDATGRLIARSKTFEEDFLIVDFDARDHELHIHAFHAFPEELTLLKTQSIFEIGEPAIPLD